MLALAAPAPALANGDPASHWLLVQDVFFPFERKLSDGVKRELADVVAEANANGYPVKAAVINTRSDLGLVHELFGRPQEYAEYLGGELGAVFEGHLLIAMPQGLGLSHRGGRPDPEGRPIVAAVPVGEGADATGEAAAAAVERLAAVSGASDDGFPTLLVAAAAVTLVAAGAVAALVVFARRRARVAAEPDAG